jgi:hypothetical protein
LELFTFIYILKDPITLDIKYVGKSDNPFLRLTEHIRKSKYKKTYKNNWINGLLDIGLKPLIEIIEKVPVSEWSNCEKKWIHYYKNSGCKLTNLTDGGDGGNFGDFVNKLISQKLKGRIFSEKTIKLMSESAKKRKISDKGRKSLSEKRKGENNPMFGKKQSIKCIISKLKPIIQYSLTGDFIKEWKSLKEVSEYLLINRNCIRMVCNGQRKSAGGYKWEFKKK